MHRSRNQSEAQESVSQQACGAGQQSQQVCATQQACGVGQQSFATQQLQACISERPTLQAWLREYEEIEAEYLAALSSYGIAFAKRGAFAEELAMLKQRLHEKGACFRNGDASIVVGSISPACIACTGDQGSRTFTLSTACNRNCYFCFNVNQEDYDETRTLKATWREELQHFLAQPNVTHVALTGGEPLLHKDESVEFFERCHEAHPGAYLRLYTAGDFLDESLLERLRDAGLQELRLSVKIDIQDDAPEAVIAEAVELLVLAARSIPQVMVEMPVIPGTGDAMRHLLRELDRIGIFGINLLEFGYPMGDWAPFAQRGFEVVNPPFLVTYDYEYAAGLPISGSELLCLELLEFALDEGLQLGVHYCSLENKHRDQVFCANRFFTPDPRIYTLDTEDFFYKTLKVFDCDTPVIEQRLRSAGIPYELDEEDGSLSFNRRAAGQVRSDDVLLAESTYIIQQGETGVGLRELKLEIYQA